MCRLTQDVVSLDIQPTIEDVFHADTTSVEDYLKQVEESTILAAIQVNAWECFKHIIMINRQKGVLITLMMACPATFAAAFAGGAAGYRGSV